jgi:hypothetical protein
VSPGPLPKQQRPLHPYVTAQFKRRVAAHLLFERGFSLALVAIELGWPIDSLKKWDAEGRPLKDLRGVVTSSSKIDKGLIKFKERKNNA